MLFPEEEGRRAVQTADGHHGHDHQEALRGGPPAAQYQTVGFLVTPDHPAHVLIRSQFRRRVQAGK